MHSRQRRRVKTPSKTDVTSNVMRGIYKRTKKNRHPIRLWNPAMVMPVLKYNPPQNTPRMDAMSKCATNNV
jgi:hypothetical protein